MFCHRLLSLFCLVMLPLWSMAAENAPRFVSSADGTRIAYTVTGQGPDLVLLHGLMGTGASWEDPGYVEALSGRFRLIRVDLRGHGNSDGPTDPNAYGAQQLAADIAAVVQAESDTSPILWGYSAGGGVAMATVALYPALFSKVIIGGSFRAAVGFPEGATEGMVANARRIKAMADLPAGEQPANMQTQNIAAIAAYLERGSYFDPWVQASLKNFTGPALLYLGSEDAAQMHAQEAAIGKHISAFFNDLTYVELPGTLSHGEAFSESALVLEHLGAFLEQ